MSSLLSSPLPPPCNTCSPPLLLLPACPPRPPPGLQKRCSGCSVSWSPPGSGTGSSRRGRRSVRAGGPRSCAAAGGWAGRRWAGSLCSCRDAPPRGCAPRGWWRDLRGHAQGQVSSHSWLLSCDYLSKMAACDLSVWSSSHRSGTRSGWRRRK